MKGQTDPPPPGWLPQVQQLRDMEESEVETNSTLLYLAALCGIQPATDAPAGAHSRGKSRASPNANDLINWGTRRRVHKKLSEIPVSCTDLMCTLIPINYSNKYETLGRNCMLTRCLSLKTSYFVPVDASSFVFFCMIPLHAK